MEPVAHVTPRKTGEGPANWEGRVVQITRCKEIKRCPYFFLISTPSFPSVMLSLHLFHPLGVGAGISWSLKHRVHGVWFRQPGAELPAPQHRLCSRWSPPACGQNGSTRRFVELRFAVCVWGGTTEAWLTFQTHVMIYTHIYRQWIHHKKEFESNPQYTPLCCAIIHFSTNSSSSEAESCLQQHASNKWLWLKNTERKI